MLFVCLLLFCVTSFNVQHCGVIHIKNIVQRLNLGQMK